MRHMSELVDSVLLPLTEYKEAEVINGVAELAQVYEALKEGLEPLEFQARGSVPQNCKEPNRWSWIGKGERRLNWNISSD